MAQSELTNLINKINKVIRDQKNVRVAISSVLPIHKSRIFEDGKDASGNKIGTYSTTPISISKKSQAKNTGKTYFSGGYAQYKTSIGKNPGYVILRNTDQMMQDYGIIKAGKNYGLGFQNDENYKKSIWMQDKYDKSIFDHSDAEIEMFADVIVAQLTRSI